MLEKQPPEVFYKKCVLKFFELTGKHLCQSLFLIGLRPATLFKKRLNHRCFSVNFAKKNLNTFFTEHFRATVSDAVEKSLDKVSLTLQV